MLMRFLYTITCLLAGIVCLPVHAGLSNVHVRENQGITTIEVTFDEALILRPKLIEGRVSSFVLELNREDNEIDPSWSTSELQIDDRIACQLLLREAEELMEVKRPTADQDVEKTR